MGICIVVMVLGSQLNVCGIQGGIHYGQSEFHTFPQRMVSGLPLGYSTYLFSIMPHEICSCGVMIELDLNEHLYRCHESLLCISLSFSISYPNFSPLQQPRNSDIFLHLCRKAIVVFCADHFFISVPKAHFMFVSSSNSVKSRICFCVSLSLPCPNT